MHRKLEQFKSTMLNLEIQDFHYKLSSLEKKLKDLEKKIENLLPIDIQKSFYDFQLLTLNKIYDTALDTKCKKLSKLMPEPNNWEQDDEPNKWFFNLTKIVPPQSVIDTVSLGNKFNLDTNKLNKNQVIENIKCLESNLYKIDQKLHDQVRTKVTSIIAKHQDCQKNIKHIPHAKKQLVQGIEETKKFMKNNPNIMFIPADKGSVSVMVDRGEYVNKVETMLADTSTYVRIDKNPLMDMLDQEKELVMRWSKKGCMRSEDFDRSYKTSANLPRAYALPKIHKKNHPYRIIVSSVGSPFHEFSKYLQKVLSHGLGEENYSVKNSEEFIEDIKHEHIPEDHMMVSLDVTSLFTCIPNELVIKSVKARWDMIRKHCGIPWREMETALNVILNSTYFQFNGKYYQQINGCPMGSPLSPIFAEFVMRDLENHCIDNLQEKPLIYKRYVDDIFCILRKNNVDNFTHKFNKYHDSMKFTLEKEENKTLNFLDVSVNVNDNCIKTNWYRKPTYSGRVLHFLSNHPLHQKKAMVYNLVDKAILLSSGEFHETNIKIVKDILRKNCYPENFVKRNINSRLNRLTNPNNCFIKPDNPFIVLPYNNAVLSASLSRYFRSLGIRIIHKIDDKLDFIVKKGKDKLSTSRQHNVVYQIKCKTKNCHLSYIGQTKRALETRMKEHKNNWKLDHDKWSVVSDHRLLYDHEFDWEKIKILDVERNWYKRNISEMLHIKTNDTLNKQTDTNRLNNIYKSILKNFN